ncbi:MAG TPA: hypothetical protein VKV73_11145, partial [Chloroflexota bacterium]|nr:hypothetical protein [Chloroflexota bacterium]
MVRVVEKVDDAPPDGVVEGISADDNLHAVATPILGWQIAAMLSRGAPIAGSLAVTGRLSVDVQTVAAL